MNKSFKEFVAFFRKDTYVVTDKFLFQDFDKHAEKFDGGEVKYHNLV